MNHLRSVYATYITGDYASGIDSGIIDITIVGKFDCDYLSVLIQKVKEVIKRKVRVSLISYEEYQRLGDNFSLDKMLTVWKSGAAD